MTEHTELIKERWEATGGDNLLRSFEDFQGFFDSIPDRRKLVETVMGGQLYAVCIDERLVGSRSLLPAVANYVRMAGEGILNPNAEADLIKAGVNGIIAHRACGAKVLFSEDKGEGHPDEIGLSAVRDLADRVSIPLVQVVTSDEFRTSLHDARAIYYDGTGRFDWSRVENFIPGFIVSRGLLSNPSYAQAEVNVAVSIAQGAHGFGKKFTDKNPLYLVGITDNQPGSTKAADLHSELMEVAAKNQAVVVDLVLTV